MRLRPIIRGALNAVWSLLDTDILYPVTYQRISRSYSMIAGHTDETVTSKSIRAAFTERVDLNATGRSVPDALLGERVILVRHSDLGFEPEVGDRVVIEGDTWTTTAVRGEPGLYWELSIRR